MLLPDEWSMLSFNDGEQLPFFMFSLYLFYRGKEKSFSLIPKEIVTNANSTAKKYTSMLLMKPSKKRCNRM
jgi:hypothetical protein